MNWVITIPKTVKWSDYQKELDTVADGSVVMNYRTRYFPKEMKVGDRCYIVWNGMVRGWMEITGMGTSYKPWVCTTTGVSWPAGKYIERTGEFHPVDGPAMTGFRGVRKFDA